MGKLEDWKEKLLNQAGKEVLIKAVIQAIPSYAMSVVRFPKGFCEKLCSKVSRFWWSRNGRDRSIHWKSWEFLTRRKKIGDIGFKDFYFMNLAYLGKQAWRIITEPEALWLKFLKSIYFPQDDFLQVKNRRGGSCVWNSILEGRNLLPSGGKWLVGDGRKIKVWKDKWLGSG